MSTSMRATSHEVRDTAGSYALAEAGGEAVRAGYKRTEVGVIPEDWALMRLGEHASFRTGPFGSALHKSDYTDGGVPVINPMHIINGELAPTSAMSITEAAAVGLSEFRFKANEIVIGRRGDMGRCAVVRKKQVGWLCGTGSMIVRCSNSVDPDFLQRVLSSPGVIRAIEGSSVGSTMINLNQGVLAGLKLQYPPIREQRAIATALSDVDALLVKLDQLIAKKRDLKQAAMQQLLAGKTRLPGFTDEWTSKRLGDISDISMGGTPRRLNPAYWGEGHPWLSIADMKSKVIIESKEEITSVAAERMSVVPKGTLLMSFKLSIGRMAFAGCDLFTNEAICSFGRLQASAEFLYYALQRVDFALYGKQAVKGYTLNKQSLKLIEVMLPELAEQTAIAILLSDMDAELAALETRRDKTLELKQGMMQALLTGRIRLT